jgi:branched-chain amino acid transport system substrate-binding protein
MLYKKILVALSAFTAIASAHAGEVAVGSVLGVTGPNAASGAEGAALITGYFEMINASGGVNGNTLKRIIKDDQYDPRKTAGLVEEAITKDNVVALFSAVGTANTVAIMKSGILNKTGVPLVGVFSGADVLRGPGSEQIFHTRASYTDEIMKISRLAATLGLKRIAVLYQDDGFGAGINQSIAKAAEQYQLEVVNKTPYKPGDTDLSQQAKQIIDAKPQAIFLMGVPDAVVRFMKVYDAPIGASQIYTLSFVPAKMLVQAVGENKVRGMGISQVVPNPETTTLPLAKEFQTFLKTPYAKGAQSNATNFESFMNAKLVVEAIRMAGANPTPEKVTKALMSMNGYRLAGYPISFSPTNRSGSHYLDIGVVGRNGRINY